MPLYRVKFFGTVIVDAETEEAAELIAADRIHADNCLAELLEDADEEALRGMV